MLSALPFPLAPDPGTDAATQCCQLFSQHLQPVIRPCAASTAQRTKPVSMASSSSAFSWRIAAVGGSRHSLSPPFANSAFGDSHEGTYPTDLPDQQIAGGGLGNLLARVLEARLPLKVSMTGGLPASRFPNRPKLNSAPE